MLGEQGQHYSRALQALCHLICLSFLHRDAPRTCPQHRVYTPEMSLLCLESTLSYKPTGEVSTLQDPKDQGVPMSLCTSLSAG